MNPELPLGFGMAPAQNEAAMKRFESLPRRKAGRSCAGAQRHFQTADAEATRQPQAPEHSTGGFDPKRCRGRRLSGFRTKKRVKETGRGFFRFSPPPQQRFCQGKKPHQQKRQVSTCRFFVVTYNSIDAFTFMSASKTKSKRVLFGKDERRNA